MPAASLALPPLSPSKLLFGEDLYCMVGEGLIGFSDALALLGPIRPSYLFNYIGLNSSLIRRS